MRAALLLCFAWAAVGLQLHEHPSTAMPAKKFAYVTMMFDPERLTDEDRSKMVNPHAPGQVAGPYYRDGRLKPYDDKTLGLGLNRERDAAEGDRPIPGEPLGRNMMHFVRVLKIADQLQKVGSQYPLIVITNMAEKLELARQHPNLIVHWMERPFTDRKCIVSTTYETVIQKILLWGLTDYDKLMWLDSDIIVKKNPDSVFEIDLKGGVMGMVSDPFCDYTPEIDRPEWVANRSHYGRDAITEHHIAYQNTSMHDFASSIMLLEPKLEDLEGMKELSKELKRCGTDQEIIAEHFWRKAKSKEHETVQFFTSEVALWARCTDQRWFVGKKVPDPMIVHHPDKKGFHLKT